jgi:hypothetical protein
MDDDAHKVAWRGLEDLAPRVVGMHLEGIAGAADQRSAVMVVDDADAELSGRIHEIMGTLPYVIKRIGRDEGVLFGGS